VLYRSDDRGASWQQVSDVSSLPDAITDMAPESRNTKTLWAVSGGKLLVSTDGGVTFAAPSGLPTERQATEHFTAVDVGPIGDGESIFSASELVIGYSDTGTTALATYDRGASFFPLAAPAGVDAADHGRLRTDLIVSTTGATSHIFQIDLGTGRIHDITPVDYAGAFSASATRGKDVVSYAKTNDRLLRFSPIASRKTTVAAPDIPYFRTPGVPPPPPAGFTPKHNALTIPYNQRRTVNYNVGIPPRPTPVDVMFLVDTSGSMQGTIDALKDGLNKIAKGLSDLRIDAQAGLAEYNVVREPGGTQFRPSECANQPAMFERLRDIGRIDSDLLERIAALRACGSGPEPVLIALDQLATGSGRDAVRIGAGTAPNAQCSLVAASPGCSVRPGQQAHWRPGTVRIVVNATDEQFLNGPDSKDYIPDQPSVAEIAAHYA
ncbi:MAG: hypothetical protein ABR520_12690, partial [Mycobacteriales bacterium]